MSKNLTPRSRRPKRKDPLTRLELVEALEKKVCVITYTPPGQGRKTIRATLMPSILGELDNRPIGFETNREAAMFDMHCVNCLDIDRNQWVSIAVGTILELRIP